MTSRQRVTHNIQANLPARNIVVAHVTDPHFGEGERSSEVDAVFRRFVDQVRSGEQHPVPDFIIVGGDMTVYGTRYPGQITEARRALDTVGVPWVGMGGNHDVAAREGFRDREPFEDYEDLPLEETQFALRMPPDGLRFSFEAGGVSWIGFTLRDEDHETVDWLDGELCRAKRAVVAGHYPLYYTRTNGPLASWGFARVRRIAPRLRQTLAAHRRKVLFYLHGHTHVNALVREDGFAQVGTAPLTSSTCEYRILCVDGQALRVSTHAIRDLQVRPALWIEGADEKHPTPLAYCAGTPEERDFDVPCPCG